MKNGLKRMVVLLIIALGLLTAFGCPDNAPEQKKQPPNTTDKRFAPQPHQNAKPPFVVYAGSEMNSLEPMIRKWAKKQNVNIRIRYKGSIDMMRMMAGGLNTDADAYWLAHTIWFILGDPGHVVKNKRSIMVSPIVAGLKQSIVKRLGWDTQSPTLAAFLAAAKNKEFRYAKTSSTQSNSGALFHLAAWWAFAGRPADWSMDMVNDKALQARVKEMESTVSATSGSSGWLKAKMMASVEQLDGMINYEAMVSEANLGWTTIDRNTGKAVEHKGLIKKGKEPLHVVYIADATMMADHPLGYVDKGDHDKAHVFDALQKYLLTAGAQKQMIELGRRNPLLATDPSLADIKAFDPELGFDVSREIAPIRPPREDVLTAILDLYQEEVRKPSATFWVIDDSGSMYKNGGKQAVQEAMSILLTPAKAREYKLQPTARDIHVILPFGSKPGSPVHARGNNPAVLGQLMAQVSKMHLGGGTNIYSGVVSALEFIKANENQIKDHFPAVAVLSDGISEGSPETVAQAVARLELEYIPIHTLSFGAEVDENQLEELAKSHGGRYFSGKKDVAKAFRKMKGYN